MYRNIKNIKCLILGAGYGRRLGRLTKDMPKPMVDVAGKPIMQHICDWLLDYGIVNIAVNVHYQHEKIMEHFGPWIVYSYERKLLGTAGSIKKLAGWFGTSMFLVVNGDTLTNLNIDNFLAAHVRSFMGNHNIKATVYKDPKTGVCAGAMIFDWTVFNELPDEGMIDDVLPKIKTASYYEPESYWIDCGTKEGLEKARELYGRKTNTVQ